MKAKHFDKKFNNGKNISKFLDLSKAKRAGRDVKRVNVDFPFWMLSCLDEEAKKLGVSRQAIIKVWIAERMKRTL